MLFKAAQLYPNNVNILFVIAIASSFFPLSSKQSAKRERRRTLFGYNCAALNIAITNKIFKIIDKKSINPETQEECNSLLHAGQYLLSKGDVDKAISYYKKDQASKALKEKGDGHCSDTIAPP